MIWAWILGTLLVAGLVSLAGWYAIGLLDIHREKIHGASCSWTEIPDVEDLSRATDELLRQFRRDERAARPRTG